MKNLLQDFRIKNEALQSGGLYTFACHRLDQYSNWWAKLM